MFHDVKKYSRNSRVKQPRRPANEEDNDASTRTRKSIWQTSVRVPNYLYVMSGRFAIFAITLTTRRAASARLPAPSHHGCRRNAIVDGEQWISIAIPGTFRSCDSGKIRRGVALIKVTRKVAAARICTSRRACLALTSKNVGNPDEIAGRISRIRASRPHHVRSEWKISDQGVVKTDVTFRPKQHQSYPDLRSRNKEISETNRAGDFQPREVDKRARENND